MMDDTNMRDLMFAIDLGKRLFLTDSVLYDKLAAELVIFNPPYTIVKWSDGTKTTSKCGESDAFSEEIGFAMTCAKKLLGSYGAFHSALENARRVKADHPKKNNRQKAACCCKKNRQLDTEKTSVTSASDIVKAVLKVLEEAEKEKCEAGHE